MAGINKVILLGTVVTAPVVEYTPSGKAITRCSFETNQKVVCQRGIARAKTEIHSIVAYGRMAENWRDYWPKGTILFIEGQLQSRIVDNTHSGAASRNRIVEVVARLVRLIGEKKGRSVVAPIRNEGVFLNDGYPW